MVHGVICCTRVPDGMCPSMAEFALAEAPIIGLAVPRSGSQLLRALLNAHPDVLVAADSDLLSTLFGETSRVSIDRALHREAPETHRTYAHLLAALRVFLHAFWTSTDEVRARGKSSPRHWGWIEYGVPARCQEIRLLELYPRGRYVHIVRDGRDVVASWLANWDVASYQMPIERRDPAAIGALWVEWVRAASGYPALTIRLEDLHDGATRRATVERLLAHLDLELPPSVERFVDNLPWVNFQRREVHRWKTDVDAPTLAALTGVDGFTAMLEQYGYAS